MFNESLLTEKQAAEILGITLGTLAVWRCTRRYKISFVKVGRLVRYRRSALNAFLDSRTHDGEI